MNRLPRSDTDLLRGRRTTQTAARLEGLELIEEHWEVIVKLDSFKERRTDLPFPRKGVSRQVAKRLLAKREPG